eukprot:TRINITY_DN1572_c0_g1_i1.p1 TRINITY_DN1572_c0_g1~~TRINITY_DN1572_c0_g1_i1.p1  ORF type:complete len:469 (+),score=94.66 TRINITY_DN1572_c0_g1_i1:186-1409(+)
MAYDSIGAIAPFLGDELDLEVGQLGLLISIYSAPNIVLAFFGGFLCDKIGYNRASLIFSGIVTVGASIVAMASGYPTMCLGRFLFGMGSESLIVAQTAVLTKWFKGKELALSFGVALTFGRLGSIIALQVLPEISINHGWRWALWITACVCAVSLLLNLVMVFIDSRGLKILKEGQELSDVSSEEISIFSITKLSLPFWMLVLICVSFYGSGMSFTMFATEFFTDRYEYGPTAAAKYTSYVYMSSMIASPLFGWAADIFGYRVHLLILGSLILIPVFLCFAFTFIHPTVLVSFLGISFSLVPAALWPSVALIEEEKMIGTAFGVLYSIYNFAIFVSPIIFGHLRDRTQEWTAGNIYFGVLGIVGTITSIALYFQDLKLDHILKQPSPGATKPPIFTRKFWKEICLCP